MLAQETEHKNTDKLENKIKAIKLEATRLTERPGTDFKNSIHWSIVLNGKVTIEYSEGIGHFIKQSPFKRCTLSQWAEAVLLGKEKVNSAFSWQDYQSVSTPRVKWRSFGLFTINPPKVKDVLYSLTMDADAVNYTFDEWCSNYGYDTDSRKALDTWHECTNSYRKLRALGLDLEELQEFFTDY